MLPPGASNDDSGQALSFPGQVYRLLRGDCR